MDREGFTPIQSAAAGGGRIGGEPDGFGSKSPWRFENELRDQG